jgi:hypothetical protein
VANAHWMDNMVAFGAFITLLGIMLLASLSMFFLFTVSKLKLSFMVFAPDGVLVHYNEAFAHISVLIVACVLLALSIALLIFIIWIIKSNKSTPKIAIPIKDNHSTSSSSDSVK